LIRCGATIGFGRREVAKRLEQAPVVDPVDLFEGDGLDRVIAASGAASMTKAR